MEARAGYGSKKNEGRNTRYRCTQRLRKRLIFGLNALTWRQINGASRSMVFARFNEDTMKKTCFFKFVFAVALSVAAPAQVPAQSSAYLIRAGQSIGRIHVGVKGDFDLKRFPKPDVEDSYTSHSIKFPIIYPDLRLDYKVATHPGLIPYARVFTSLRAVGVSLSPSRYRLTCSSLPSVNWDGAGLSKVIT